MAIGLAFCHFYKLMLMSAHRFLVLERSACVTSSVTTIGTPLAFQPILGTPPTKCRTILKFVWVTMAYHQTLWGHYECTRPTMRTNIPNTVAPRQTSRPWRFGWLGWTRSDWAQPMVHSVICTKTTSMSRRPPRCNQMFRLPPRRSVTAMISGLPWRPQGNHCHC